MDETTVNNGHAGTLGPLYSLPGGVTASRFHLPVVATTFAEKQKQAAADNVLAAVTPPTPIRTPNPYRSVQSRLVLTYGRPRTSVWGENQG